jgi:hypothetical protein
MAWHDGKLGTGIENLFCVKGELEGSLSLACLLLVSPASIDRALAFLHGVFLQVIKDWTEFAMDLLYWQYNAIDGTSWRSLVVFED